MEVVSFTLQPLYPQGKSPPYPLDRRLGGLQSRSGHGVEEKNSQPPPGIEPRSSDRPARNQSLYRLRYRGSELQKDITESCTPWFCTYFIDVIFPDVHISLPFKFIYFKYLSQYSDQATGRTTGVRFPAWAGIFSLHHRVQDVSGVQSASYQMGTLISFAGVKRPGREADHSLPYSTVESYFIPHTSPWRCT
jgi:hypothetical protein